MIKSYLAILLMAAIFCLPIVGAHAQGNISKKNTSLDKTYGSTFVVCNAVFSPGVDTPNFKENELSLEGAFTDETGKYDACVIFPSDAGKFKPELKIVYNNYIVAIDYQSGGSELFEGGRPSLTGAAPPIDIFYLDDPTGCLGTIRVVNMTTGEMHERRIEDESVRKETLVLQCAIDWDKGLVPYLILYPDVLRPKLKKLLFPFIP